MFLIIASILIGGSYCFHLSDGESEAQEVRTTGVGKGSKDLRSSGRV